MLTHPEDRFSRYVHNSFGQVIYEVNAEGYVTEHQYHTSDKPSKTWFYPQKIILPKLYSLSAISDLLPPKDQIPLISNQYDAASRKISSTDQLGYEEHYKLDALDNLREYLDKGGDSWLFNVDSANRKIEEATPPTEVTRVTEQGLLIKPQGLQRIIKKIEYKGDVQRIIEAYNTPEARVIDFHRNAVQQIIQISQEEAGVYDKSKIPTRFIEDYFALGQHAQTDAEQSSLETLLKQNGELQFRPEKKVTLSSKTIYNSFKQAVVLIDEAGSSKFKIYDAGQLRYEIDQEGFVTTFKYNLFGNVIQLTRHALALELNLSPYTTIGLPLELVESILKSSSDDRCLYFKFDRANRLIQTTQSEVFTYIPHLQGQAQHGLNAPVKKIAYTTFGEIYSEKELVDPFNDLWNENRAWFNKLGHVIAQVNGLNYLTLFATDRYGNDKKKIEYAKKLQITLDEEISVKEMLQGLEMDPDHDRIYTNEFNARNELVRTIQHKVRLYDPELDISAIPYLPLQEKEQNITHEFIRNAKGLLLMLRT
ncbi:hypothetical protein [Legionella sp. km772]|uniref:hypothetical protein n=1 Tax=Legionella sp. km772 TaxID=2498111 RepID=UPI000F8E3305|nr:hypothetical protein [Legionella sp. km772]RUR04466.1 hypothetical protein ELY15_15470 [Legionella sp. km772]